MKELTLITILLVEDSEPFRKYVSSMLRKHEGLRVIAEVADGLEAVKKATELKPDLILLDLALPTLSGIEAARQVRHLPPRLEGTVLNRRILFRSGTSSVGNWGARLHP